MESNINLYKFIFYKSFSANKQHKYKHNGYKKHIQCCCCLRRQLDRGETTTFTTTTTTQLVILNLN